MLLDLQGLVVVSVKRNVLNCVRILSNLEWLRVIVSTLFLYMKELSRDTQAPDMKKQWNILNEG